jgi:predicted DNA binding CopG/RHH family protein
VDVMKVKSTKKKVTDEEYYDKRGVLGEIVEGDVMMSLDDALKQDILSGKRKRKLRNITIKLDPLYLLSIKKVATKKGIPYQTLVRQWVAENIRKELKIA